jgi:uncharacterized membrane protein
LEAILRAVAAVSTGIFFGAALYISLVQQPAALATGGEFAARFFPEMYARAAVLQAGSALIGALAAFAAWYYGARPIALIAVVLLIGIILFTLVVVAPLNQELIDGSVDPSSERAAELLLQWGRLHWLRTIAGGIAFLACLRAAPGPTTPTRALP